MKTIPLTKGKVAIVDDSDFDWLSQWKWSAGGGPQFYYASRNERIKGPPRRQRTILMHRAILGIQSSGTIVDHENRNTLDNRRSNLRLATYQKNAMNRMKQGKLPYKGIYLNRGSKKNPWVAEIKKDGRSTHLGVFPTMELAARAYDRAARKLFGEFAFCNFRDSGSSEVWSDDEHEDREE